MRKIRIFASVTARPEDRHIEYLFPVLYLQEGSEVKKIDCGNVSTVFEESANSYTILI